MTVFHLVRHGSHDLLGRVLTGRTRDVGLNDRGRSEAAALAEHFAGRPLAAVYASPLRRAFETARPIAGRSGVDLLLEPRLTELDFGVWSGLAFDALDADPHWRRWNAFRSGARPPGGETMIEAQARIVGLMIDLRDRLGEAELALVSHADLIRAALAWWQGIPLELFQRIDVAPALVSSIALTGEGASIRALNERVPGSA